MPVAPYGRSNGVKADILLPLSPGISYDMLSNPDSSVFLYDADKHLHITHVQLSKLKKEKYNNGKFWQLHNDHPHRGNYKWNLKKNKSVNYFKMMADVTAQQRR